MDEEKDYPIIEQLKSERYDGPMPSNYLDDLAQRTWSSESSEIRSRSRLIPMVYRIAAAVILFIGCYGVIQYIQSDVEQPPLFADVSDDELLAYAMVYSTDFNNEFLWEEWQASSDDIEDLDPVDQEALDFIEIEELEQYLIQEEL